MPQKGNKRSEALCARNALLVQWLLTLPWRQRNIRECRIGDPEQANLFKAEKPRFVHLALSPWIEDAIRLDPHFRFWQFHFRPHETKTGSKTGHEVRGIVPRQLLSPLEDYLDHHRPTLLRRSDPGTLFLNKAGGALSDCVVLNLVSSLTLRYVNRRVTPHIFRDIVAYKWLDDHPEDYLTLSKLLWHADIRTTLRIYGRSFDESNGAVRMEAWLEKRAAC